MRQDAIILYKATNQGNTVLCNPTLAELRQVADDMHAFYGYGMALSNAINMNLGDPPMATLLSAAPLPWPDKPSSPRILNYTGGPQRVRHIDQDS
jgi:hypothetical protein